MAWRGVAIGMENGEGFFGFIFGVIEDVTQIITDKEQVATRVLVTCTGQKRISARVPTEAGYLYT